MFDLRMKVLAGVLLLSLLGLLYVQHKLNVELSERLNQTATELANVKQSVKDSIASQNAITEHLNQLQITQYNNQQQLKKKLVEIKKETPEVQQVELSNEYNKILDCIEKTTIGEKCE